MIPSLGPRLGAVAGLVLPGKPLVDVGTDHAYLPSHLVARGVCPRAIAGDRLPGPLKAARRTVSAAGVGDRVDVRHGDGLTVADPGGAANVVIAGMGGSTICGILERARALLPEVERLVVQPNTEWEQVRLALHGLGRTLVDEVLTEEAGKFYLVMASAPMPDPRPPPRGSDLAFGPLIRARGGDTFRRMLEQRRDRLRAAVSGARRGREPGRADTLAAALERVQNELIRLAGPCRESSHRSIDRSLDPDPRKLPT